MNSFSIVPLAGATLLLLGPVAAADTIRYEVVDLGRTEAYSDVCPCFFANAVNASGDVAGFFFGTDGTYNAFAHRDGAMADISPEGDNRTFGRGINDAGHVVGWTNVVPVQRAFLHDGETFHLLPTLGGDASDAHDVNNAGQVVGSAYTRDPNGFQRPAVWEDGSWRDLGTLGGEFGEALAINDAGLIVGWAWNPERDRRAVSWTAAGDGPFELPSFGPPGRFTIANAISEAGVIAGQVEIEPFEGQPRYRAAVWEDGEVVDLGLLPEAGQGSNQFGLTPHVSTVATGINSAGVVVGASFPDSEDPPRPGPFVHRDGLMTNLNDLLFDTSWLITKATAINEAGAISGSARRPGSNHSHAVRLEPVVTIPGDTNGDGRVDLGDLLAILASWGDCRGCPTDLDADGVVGFADLLIVLANWSA